MNEIHSKIATDLHNLGIRPGDLILVHASLRSLGKVPGGAEAVILGLLQAVGEGGTLLMPALSYEQQPPHLHDTRYTPSNVGALPEFFRLRPGTRRSLHPTHSACGVGPAVADLFRDHLCDHTPCGPHSPFHLLPDWGGKIVMLGCGLKPNTSMHAFEEYVIPPYLFNGEREYTITDEEGNTIRKVYTIHDFHGWEQRYDRVAELPDTRFLRRGRVLEAETFVLDATGLRAAVLKKLRQDPLFFVDRTAV